MLLDTSIPEGREYRAGTNLANPSGKSSVKEVVHRTVCIVRQRLTKAINMQPETGRKQNKEQTVAACR